MMDITGGDVNLGTGEIENHGEMGVIRKITLMHLDGVRTACMYGNAIVSKDVIVYQNCYAAFEIHPSMVHTVITDVTMGEGEVRGLGEKPCTSVRMKITGDKENLISLFPMDPY